MFAKSPSLAQRIAEQADLDKIDETAAHARAMHRILEELQDALEQANPKIKYEQATLDPNQEVIVRYEEGRYRYAIYTTETAGTSINVQLMSGFTFKIVTTGPTWLALDYPPGTRLFSGDANRHVILVRISNLKV
jgi:hypothetical protein